MMTWQDFLINQNTEPAWGYVKAYRNMRLQSSDIAVIRYTEAGLAVPSEWVAYRQALRDITNTFTDPADVVFPDPPDLPFPINAISQDERLEAAELFLGLLLDQEVTQ